MAINTSNNKVRIISTTVSGLSANSKFSDIKSPALVVNTSEGGIFYADGAGGTSLKQLAALPSHTHSGYATTASLANYLPLTGGGISSNKIIPLDINSTSTAGIGFELKNNNNQVSQFGWSSRGTYIYDYASKSYLGLTNDGTPYFNTYELLHANNYYNYALPKSGGNLEGPLRYGRHLAMPNAEYKTNGDVVGCIKIKIPANPGTAMLSFWIDVFNYSNGSSYSAYISGYAFSDKSWYQPTTFLIGNTSKIVRYGHDGTNFIICIGLPTDTYSYPNIIIRDVLLGHNANTSSFNNKWDISITNDISNINFTINWECLVLNTTNYTTYCASVGHSHSDYLPKSGGTLTGTGTILGINRTDGNPIIGFNNNGNRLGWLGFNTSYEPIAQVLENGTGVARKILHSGNYSNLLAGGTINGSLTATSFIGNLTGNATYATSAGVSSEIICTGTGDNVDRPIVATNEANKLYYSTLVKLNCSTGNITAPKFIGALQGNADSATKVNTQITSAAVHYPLLFGASADAGATMATGLSSIYKNSVNNVYFIPSEGKLVAPKMSATTFAGNLIGNADSATKATNDSSGTAFIGNYLRKVTVSNNAANDFNSFENMTLTGRGDPKASCPALVNAPASWSGSGPTGGYGVLTYLWAGYGTQMAWGYGSNRIYIRNKYYTNNAATWSSTWDSLALSSDIPTKVSQLTNDAGYTTATGHTHDDYYSASASRTKNTVLAAPNGAAGKAVFRALVAADLPTVPVSKGGTGATSLTSGAALIGNGTSAVTTRSIKNMTTKGPISNYSTALMTTNTLAYWNGAYDASNRSNLTYCNHGAFGTIVTKNAGDYLSSQTWRPIKINNSEKLANSSSTALDISAGSNVTLTWNSTNNRVTIAATDTKYTHPASTSGTYDVDTSAKTASTLAHSGTFTVVTGALRDASGHISKVVTQQLTLPGDNNTDTKVTTSASTSKLFILGKTDASKATASAANYNASVYIDGGYLYSGGTKVLTSYTDTKNTTGADNTTSKIFLVGPTAQTSSNGTARTYSNSSCYASGGYLYSGGAKVLTSYTDTKDTAGSSNKKTKIFVVGATSQSTTGVTTYSDVSVYITDGKLYASNFITSSDERIKTNIKEVKNSVDSLGLRFVEFDYKDSSNHSAGHIAQEVKEVLPEFVHEDKGEEHMLSVDYTGLHSVQIKALLDRIIKLEEEIKQLKSSSR